LTRTALLALAILVGLLGLAAFGMREWSASRDKPSAAPAQPPSNPAKAAAPAAAPSPPGEAAARGSTSAAVARPDAVPGGTTPAGSAAPPAGTAPPGGQTNPQPLASPPTPSFDIVRVGPAGGIVAAGRGEPGSAVALMAGDRELGRAPVDGRGEWVLSLPEGALPSGNHQLRLRQLAPGRTPVESDRTVVVAMPDRPVAAAATTPEKDGKKEADRDLPLVFSAPATGKQGTTVLQAPGGSPRAGDLTVGTLDYDEGGRISASGTAAPGAAVRAYVDDQPAGTATAGTDGRWRIAPDAPVSPGPHRLRIDRLGPDGRVVGRLELPFSRRLALAADGTTRPGITIVRGDNLWNIARARYGDGFLYTVIYQANRDQIRNPDLIYPGQVFATPAR
jgi:nucleoid-associated protein YgaU